MNVLASILIFLVFAFCQTAFAVPALPIVSRKCQTEDEPTLEHFRQASRLAIPVLEGKVAQGDAFAAYVLGWKYYEGTEVQKDLKKFLELNLVAAEQGIATSQMFVASSYLNGEGTEINKPEAIKWLLRIAARADSLDYCDLQSSSAWWNTFGNGEGETDDRVVKCIWQAEFMLGTLYKQGNGVPKDYAQAFQWFRKTAEQGCPSAQLWLGLLLVEGKGFPTDYAEAVYWFEKAAQQGNENARQELERYRSKKQVMDEVMRNF